MFIPLSSINHPQSGDKQLDKSEIETTLYTYTMVYVYLSSVHRGKVQIVIKNQAAWYIIITNIHDTYTHTSYTVLNSTQSVVY